MGREGEEERKHGEESKFDDNGVGEHNKKRYKVTTTWKKKRGHQRGVNIGGKENAEKEKGPRLTEKKKTAVLKGGRTKFSAYGSYVNPHPGKKKETSLVLGKKDHKGLKKRDNGWANGYWWGTETRDGRGKCTKRNEKWLI